MAEPTTCVVVALQDAAKQQALADAAGVRARESGARVIVYDAAAAGRMTSPRPNVWAGEGEAAVYDHPLDPVDLEKLGRHDLALVIERLRSAGTDAYAWLPDHMGGAELAAYAARENADLVLLAPDLEPDLAPALDDAGTRVEILTTA
jgi:hypothetical protein